MSHTPFPPMCAAPPLSPSDHRHFLVFFQSGEQFLDLASMRHAAAALEGTHDFRALTAMQEPKALLPGNSSVAEAEVLDEEVAMVLKPSKKAVKPERNLRIPTR